MIGFIGTSLKLQSHTRAHALNSYLTASVLRITMKKFSLLPEYRAGLYYYSNWDGLILRPTVSRLVSLGIKLGLTTRFLIFWQLQVCWYGVLSLTRGRVCLQLLLALANAVILRSESRGTCDHILLSQTWDFLFRRLLRLANIRPRLHMLWDSTRIHECTIFIASTWPW
jgi:hypothetical protein